LPNHSRKTSAEPKRSSSNSVLRSTLATSDLQFCTMPKGMIQPLMRLAQERIAEYVEENTTIRPQAVFSYFIAIALEHAEGIKPTATLIRTRANATHKTVAAQAKMLSEMGLIEQGYSLNEDNYYEAWYQVSAQAIRLVAAQARKP
jgi:hypothetical protein